jgi:hypothetical protein
MQKHIRYRQHQAFRWNANRIFIKSFYPPNAPLGQNLRGL